VFIGPFVIDIDYTIRQRVVVQPPPLAGHDF
jgi:hypothetical protein